MAIALTSRGTINDATNAASYASGAFTPSASVLLVAIYNAEGSGALPTTPSVSGHGAWSNVHELAWNTDGAGGNYGKTFIFALNTGGAPGNSTVTFDHGATTHLGAEASIFELTGTDVANGVAQCFVQFVDSTINTTGGTNVLSLTLAAAGDAANRPFMSCSRFENAAAAPQTNWSEIHDLAHDGASSETQWRSNTFDTAAACTYTGVVRRGGVAFEIKNAVAGTAAIVDPMGMMGFFGA